MIFSKGLYGHLRSSMALIAKIEGLGATVVARGEVIHIDMSSYESVRRTPG